MKDPVSWLTKPVLQQDEVAPTRHAISRVLADDQESSTIGGYVELRAESTLGDAAFEQPAWRPESRRRSRLHRCSGHAESIMEEQFATVPAPARCGAAARRHLPSAALHIRIRAHVHLEAT